MYVAVITDTHAGVKNGSDIFLDYAERFYDEIFFPYCLENNISQILHLGDYFDHRRIAHIKVLSRNKKMFLDKLDEYGMHMDIIPGNHDVAYKNTNELCSLVEILQHYKDTVTLHMEPTVKDYDGLKVALLPWINAENYDESLQFIKSVDAPFLGGHLELAGFEMMKGMPANHHGMSSSIFHRFETVMSGHYHTKSTRENIHYLGTPFEHTWADADDPKYFHVIDTENRELLQIRNPITIYNRLVYDDSAAGDDIEKELKKYKYDHVRGSFIKVIVRSKKNPYLFDKYLDAINANEPFDIKIVENFDEYLPDNIEDEGLNVSDTLTLLSDYVDNVETELDKSRLKGKLHELYVEAQNSEAI